MSLLLAGLYAFTFTLAFGGLAGYVALLFMAYRDAWKTAQAEAGMPDVERWA